MRRIMLLSAGLLALGLTACGAAGAVNPAASPAAPAPTAPPDENAPEISEPAVSVEPYSDLRYLPWLDDYAKQTYQPDEYNASDLYTYTYNTGTAFAGAEDEAAALLEACKDPGLGVRSLQARGITGRGVNVAILDQPLLTDHPEFADRIAAYYDTGCEGETSSMHGPAVASLLAGKTIGIIGFGRIGQAEGRIAKAMGMRVLAYDIYPNDSGHAVGEYVDLDTLLAQSDVVSLHCNLTPENTGLINKETIAKMKGGAILLNNARGQLIVEQDVADALNSGKLAAAGLDVVYTEPIRPDNPLLTAKNCILTPHISWAPKESRQRIMEITAENIRAFLNGTPQNVVNP